MAFNDQVDVNPAHFAPGNEQKHFEEEAKMLQKRKWWVLLITFLLVFIASQAWVWSRQPIYQSQAIVHFGYAQQVNTEQNAVPIEQITLNSKRLTSNRVFDALSERLNQTLTTTLSAEQLAQMLTTEENLESRIISLYATGEDKTVLQPLLDEWLALYLDQLAQETKDSNDETLSEGQAQLLALDEKIAQQRAVVEQFSEDNNIVSMERDENRVLARIKSMGASLDTAEATQAEAEAELESAQQSILRGETVFHPDDKSRLDGLYTMITDIESELAELAKNFTPTYMNMDPDIVGKKSKLEELQSRYTTTVEESQKRYIEELKRSVTTSQSKQAQLKSQLDELSGEAQLFNQKLEEYERLVGALDQLKEQSQMIKDQLVETEVQKPFQAKITVLEKPFAPSYPLFPHYWRDAAIALGVAVFCSLFALMLFSYIHRQRAPAPSITSYNVVPQHTGLTFEQQRAAAQGLEHQRHQQLGHSAAPLKLEQQATEQARLLNENECSALFQAANKSGQLAIVALMSGVTADELLALKCQDVDIDNAALQIRGEYARSVRIDESKLSLFAVAVEGAEPEAAIMNSKLDKHQLDQMIINIAHDAGMVFPDQFSVAALRHTYVTFLVSQGARLNDIEQIAGYVSPVELSLYRQVNRNGTTVDVEALQTCFPLV